MSMTPSGGMIRRSGRTAPVTFTKEAHESIRMTNHSPREDNPHEDEDDIDRQRTIDDEAQS